MRHYEDTIILASKTFRILYVATILICIFMGATRAFGQQNNDCSGYGGTYTPPSGFGSAMYMFSSSRELMLKSLCEQRNQFGGWPSFVVVRPSPEEYTFVVYQQGYFWSGTQWLPFVFSPDTGSVVLGNYIVGGAHADFSHDNATRKPRFWVAYTCSKVSDAWKCGCRDKTCAQSYWQLQVAVPEKVWSDFSESYRYYLGKIMPLGDSITQGSAGSNTYRYYLWELLGQNNSEFDFVGSERENYNGSPNFPNTSFDREHEGHWGWRTDQILERLPGWLSATDPDTVLVHIGTNDVLQGYSVTDTERRIREIVSMILQTGEGKSVVLATLIPVRDNQNANTRIEELNARIRTMSSSHVIIVDQWSGFNASSDTYDGVHPNESGERKMAQKWYKAVLGLVKAY